MQADNERTIVRNTLRPLAPLFWDFICYAPGKVALSFGLMIASGITSGIGVLLIIPLLSVIGIDIASSPTSQAFDIGEKVTQVVNFLGIPLNLSSMLILYLLIIGSVSLISYMHTMVKSMLERNFVLDLRCKLYKQVIYAKWRYISGVRQADFIRLVTGQVSTVGVAITHIIRLISQAALAIVYLGLAFLLSPGLTLLSLLSICLLLGLLLPFNSRVHGSGQTNLKANKAIFSQVVDQIGSFKIIKSFAGEARFLERVQMANAEMTMQQIRITRFNALTSLISICGGACIFSVLFYTSLEWLKLPISNIVLILLVFSRLTPRAMGMQATMQRLIHVAPLYVDLLDNMAALTKNAEPLADDPKPVVTFNQSISLHAVGYQYPSSTEAVLTDINFRIECNKTVALIGPSGSGKSTLSDILSGLVGPSTGQMKVDGQVIDNSNRRTWRSQVAYVTQEVLLFHDSVRENLSWVLPTPPSDTQLWAVLAQAAADGFVRALPQGLDTVIGDRGVRLSGGERQRLALARALLSKPRLLILDEATNALDRQHERRIQEALLSLCGKLTIVIISHDEMTIQCAEKILDLTR